MARLPRPAHALWTVKDRSNTAKGERGRPVRARSALRSKPHPDGGELDEREVARGQLVVAGRDPAVLLAPPDQPLDGLITNDKFCLSRPGRLTLSWWRCPLRRREQAQRGAVPDTNGDRGGA